MNGTIRPDLYNLVMIGLIGFASVWLINRGIKAAGYPQYMATGGS